MYKITASILIIFLVFFLVEKTAYSQVLEFGIGRKSCAYWLSEKDREYAGDNWIFGYWTAVNILNSKNHLVGSTTDGDAIVLEIKNLCVKHPSQELSDATAKIYYKFIKDNK